jgi:hypothetical protein
MLLGLSFVFRGYVRRSKHRFVFFPGGVLYCIVVDSLCQRVSWTALVYRKYTAVNFALRLLAQLCDFALYCVVFVPSV